MEKKHSLCFMNAFRTKQLRELITLPFAEQSEFRPWKTWGDKYCGCGFVGVGGVVRLGADVVVQGGAASRRTFISVVTTGISLVTRTSIPTDCQKKQEAWEIYMDIREKYNIIKYFLSLFKKKGCYCIESIA